MTTEEFNKYRRRKGISAGLLIIAIGLLWLLRKMDLNLPGWLFEWETILIIAGIFIGFNSHFRNPVSWILIGIGSFFLIDDIFFIPVSIREYFWPLLVIFIGLLILIRPKKDPRYCRRPYKHRLKEEWKEEWSGYHRHHSGEAERDSANTIDSVCIFNGTKKTILSKNFKGGEIVTVFGGTEINMLQTDFEKTITLDTVVVFGGLKLIVPPNWEVRTNITSILGGVEDKRTSAVEVVPEDKVLVLTGVVLFGGLDIVSY